MELTRLLEKKIKPLAEEIDDDPRALKKGFKLLGKHKLLTQSLELEKPDYFDHTELIQSYSGALGFFQRQHQAAARFISNSDLKEEWVPLMRKGKRRVGVSVSHLRNPSAPCVEGRPAEGGWLLKGRVPWVSGFRLFDWLVVGFFCHEEGVEGLALIRFKKGRSLKVSPPLDTIALTSIQTLSIELRDLLVPEEHILSLKSVGTYGESSDPLSIQFVNLSALARAFLRDLDAPSHEEAYEECREAYLEKGADLALYGEMNRIATELSQIARFEMGTRSVIVPNPVERRCRELMLFSVILPAKPVTEACLKPLLH